ncbi:MAG: AarF/UbiB family protein [Acidobacteriota bacterium]
MPAREAGPHPQSLDAGDPPRSSSRAPAGRALLLVRGLCVFGVRWGARRLRRAQPPGRILGEELTVLFERLGATYIKLGQILSSRPDLLSHEVTEPLKRLQDDVAPVPAEEVRARVESATGRAIDELFEHFDDEPVASASIAQVHRARLRAPAGEDAPDALPRDVAVKVRRPRVAEEVDADFRLLRFGARLLARLPPLKAVPMEELIAELEAPIRQQLDLRLELAHLERFRSSFRSVEHVRLPRPLPALSNDTVLVMEFLDDLEKVTTQRFDETERRTAALAGLRALYKMIFQDGFVHADLHPGNVFLRPWGEVVILDTGLVAELGDQDLQDFVDFFFGLVNDRGEDCARVLWDTALYRSPKTDRVAFDEAIRALVSRHAALRSRDFEVTRFVFELIETQRRHGIRGSTTFIMTVLSMVVYDGICKLLYPECEFQREARGYLVAAKYRRYRAAPV